MITIKVDNFFLVRPFGFKLMEDMSVLNFVARVVIKNENKSLFIALDLSTICRVW